MSENVVEPERPQMAIWRWVACWISKAIRAEAHVRARAPTPTHMDARTHTIALTRVRTHTQKCVILIAFLR